MKKILILINILFLVIGGSFVILSINNSKNPKLEKVNTSEKITDEKIVNTLKKERKEQEEQFQNSVDESKAQNSDLTKEVVKENKANSKIQENNNAKQNITKKSESQEIIQEIVPELIIEAKKQEVWESMGITKDHYYNKPMFSWERIDFNTMNECLEYGDEYEPYLNGEVSYNCREVLSASGNYLGVMFDTEKLN